MASYFDQFNIIGLLSYYFTNTSLAMMFTILVCWFLFKSDSIIPSR